MIMREPRGGGAAGAGGVHVVRASDVRAPAAGGRGWWWL